MREVYRVVETRVGSEKSPRLVGTRMERSDGAELTKIVPDFQPAVPPVIQLLRPLASAVTDPIAKSNEVRTAGGSVIKKEELQGKYKHHIYG